MRRRGGSARPASPEPSLFGFGAGAGAAFTTGAGACLATSASVVAPPEPEPPLVATITAATIAPSATAPPPKIPIRARGPSSPTLSSDRPEHAFAGEPGGVLDTVSGSLQAVFGRVDACPQASGALGLRVDRLPLLIALVHLLLQPV